MKISVVRWQTHQQILTAIRYAVFVDEQKVPASIEIDAHDDDAIHVLATVNNSAVGTGRLLADGHIGRVAVLKEHRGTGLGLKLMQALMTAARNAAYNEVILSSQVHAIGFYKKIGFTTTGDVYLEAGILHQDMTLTL